MLRFLNGFILIGIALFFISIAGVASGNRLLTEPGQQPDPYAWLLYLGAAVLMLINGAISISLASRHRAEAVKRQPTGESPSGAETSAERTAD